MPKGARAGENRFKSAQNRLTKLRIDRIKFAVIPRLKALSGKVKIDSKTSFCKLCADIYNEDLPVNEKKMGYRTFEQNLDYWKIAGPLYFQYWGEGDAKEQQQRILNQLRVKESIKLKEKVRKLDEENKTLRAYLRNIDSNRAIGTTDLGKLEEHQGAEFDLTCRALKLVIDASEGIFEVDDKEMKISHTANDLEPKGGLVPKAVAWPYITWLKSRNEKVGGKS